MPIIISLTLAYIPVKYQASTRTQEGPECASGRKPYFINFRHYAYKLCQQCSIILFL